MGQQLGPRTLIRGLGQAHSFPLGCQVVPVEHGNTRGWVPWALHGLMGGPGKPREMGRIPISCELEKPWGGGRADLAAPLGQVWWSSPGSCSLSLPLQWHGLTGCSLQPLLRGATNRACLPEELWPWPQGLCPWVSPALTDRTAHMAPQPGGWCRCLTQAGACPPGRLPKFLTYQPKDFLVLNYWMRILLQKELLVSGGREASG